MSGSHLDALAERLRELERVLAAETARSADLRAALDEASADPDLAPMVEWDCGPGKATG